VPRAPLVHAVPPEGPAPTPPSDRQLWREVSTLGLLPRTAAALAAQRVARAAAARAAAPDASTVLLMPGWRAGEATMGPLGAFLRARGHDARPWGRGSNVGDPADHVRALVPRVTELAEAGARVALVGWSLGGVIAREVARAAPAAVAHVVTYGTPAVGGPTFTIGAAEWGAEVCARDAAAAAHRDATDPIRVPVTAVFSRRDRVVAWPACIDRTSRRVVHVEVRSSHAGMGVDPHVWRMVAAAVEGRDLAAVAGGASVAGVAGHEAARPWGAGPKGRAARGR